MRSSSYRHVISVVTGSRVACRSLLAVALVAALAACLDQILGPRESAVTPPAEQPTGRPTLSHRAAAAYEALRAESLFASAAVGVGAMPSHQGRYLRTLLAEPDASVIFEQLWRDAGPAGRLYALIGLYLTAPEVYKRLAPAAATDQAPIATMFGCIVSQAPAAVVAREIARGDLAREFLPDSNTTRREALMDSLEVQLSRIPPLSER